MKLFFTKNHFSRAVAVVLTLLPGAAQADQLRDWKEYQTIMWVGDSVWKDPSKVPLFIQRLREMGISTAMVTGDQDSRPWREAKMPYYVENIVNKGLCLKWNSPVKDWNAFVTGWAKDGRPESALVRPYSLLDPAWLAEADKRVTDAVRKHASFSPLAYDLRDELSTTISANPFDYDFSETSLAAFRKWLQTQYADLAALNAQWATAFASWEEVRPFTTDRIKNRMASGESLPRGNPDWQAVQALKFDSVKAQTEPLRWNFAPWADFRTFMDISLADTLDHLRQTARKIDPKTPVGIEGTQMPHAFGGYDLARLSKVLDWVEPYDICGAREIFASFMPGKPILCTVGEQDVRAARQRLWHLRLLGDQGCVVWWSEDCIDWKSPDYALTKRATGLGEVLREMRSPLAQLFGLAARETDAIAIHYSQASIQAAWLLESTVDGSTWLRRFSSYESAHNRHAKVREAWLATLHDLGWTPVFREKLDPTARVTILPQSWALSTAELADLKANKNLVLTNGQPGVFDVHGSLRAGGLATTASPWQAQKLGSAEVFADLPLDEVAAARLLDKPNLKFASWVREQLGDKQPPVSIDPEHRVRVHRYALAEGAGKLVALERNVSWKMAEDLSSGGGNEALQKPISVPVTLQEAGHIYDLRSGKKLGHGKAFTCEISPWEPTLLAILKEAIPADEKNLVERLLKVPHDAAAVSTLPPPPAEMKVAAFHKKFLSAHGFPIVASGRVNDYALKEAAFLIDLMLAKRPDVRDAMIASGARMCILGYQEYTTDVPEFAELGNHPMSQFPLLSGKDYWDRRARGTGGSRSDPYCSCGEENLLGYPGDPYAAESILIHEFAHNIHLRGLVKVDPTFDKRLRKTYDKAMAAGLWKGKYAGTNYHEYFAEGVQSWFDNNRENDHDHNHVNTRKELQEYDPGLAAHCQEVFGDTVVSYTKPATRLKDHMTGYDPTKAPKFEWPARLVEAQRKMNEVRE